MIALRKTGAHGSGSYSGSKQVSLLSPQHSQRCTLKDKVPLVTQDPSTAKRALADSPDNQNTILLPYWHDGLQTYRLQAGYLTLSIPCTSVFPYCTLLQVLSTQEGASQECYITLVSARCKPLAQSAQLCSQLIASAKFSR